MTDLNAELKAAQQKQENLARLRQAAMMVAEHELVGKDKEIARLSNIFASAKAAVDEAQNLVQERMAASRVALKALQAALEPHIPESLRLKK
jgi:hypothetical protein